MKPCFISDCASNAPHALYPMIHIPPVTKTMTGLPPPEPPFSCLSLGAGSLPASVSASAARTAASVFSVSNAHPGGR